MIGVRRVHRISDNTLVLTRPWTFGLGGHQALTALCLAAADSGPITVNQSQDKYRLLKYPHKRQREIKIETAIHYRSHTEIQNPVSVPLYEHADVQSLDSKMNSGE